MVPKEAPLIALDRKSAMCMAKNGNDTKHTRHIASIMQEKCKMQNPSSCWKDCPDTGRITGAY